MKNINLNRLFAVLKSWYKSSSLFLLAVVVMFLLISLLTTIKPTYRVSSDTLNQSISQINGASFLYLFGMENHLFEQAYPESHKKFSLSNIALQMTTSIKPNDPRSLLGRELPGFDTFDGRIAIAGEGTDYTNIPIESSPPMEIFKDTQEQTNNDQASNQGNQQTDDHKPKPTTGKKNVVFVYSTHSRESFLPELSGVTDPNLAMDAKVNVTLVAKRLADALQDDGLGAQYDNTDFISILKDKGWQYYQSYDASRPVIKQAMATNKNLKYLIDIHRDSRPREMTTLDINGKNYAKIAFVVGEEYATYEKNFKLASDLHSLMNKEFPGISRGVITKQGSGTDGKFNQDLSDHAILIEIGGVENTLEELYRTADVVADLFSEYYWQAEKVSVDSPGDGN